MLYEHSRLLSLTKTDKLANYKTTTIKSMSFLFGTVKELQIGEDVNINSSLATYLPRVSVDNDTAIVMQLFCFDFFHSTQNERDRLFLHQEHLVYDDRC